VSGAVGFIICGLCISFFSLASHHKLERPSTAPRRSQRVHIVIGWGMRKGFSRFMCPTCARACQNKKGSHSHLREPLNLLVRRSEYTYAHNSMFLMILYKLCFCFYPLSYPLRLSVPALAKKSTGMIIQHILVTIYLALKKSFSKRAARCKEVYSSKA